MTGPDPAAQGWHGTRLTRLIMMLAALAALAPLCTDLNLPVLPQQAEDLGVSDSAAQLTITAVLLGLATGQLVAGPVSDRFGRRPLLLGGLAAFGLGNLVSAAVPSNGPLIVVRLLTGLAAASAVVVTRAVIADVLPGPAAARGFASLASVMGVVPAAAPLAGAALSYVTGWRGMFVFLAGVAAVLWVMTWFAIPETLAPQQRRSAHPSAIVRGLAQCLRSRRFTANVLALAMSGGVLFTYISSSSFVLQNLYGLNPTQYGIVFAANAIGIFTLANVSRRTVAAVGPHRLLTIGQLQMAAGGGVLLLGQLAGLGVWSVLVGYFVAVSSLGLVMSSGTALGMQAAPGGAGSASGLLGIAPFAFGGLVAPLSGLSSSGLAMALVIATCAVLGVVLRRVVLRGAPGAPDVRPEGRQT